MIKKSVVIKARKLNIKKMDYITIILFTVLLCGIIIGIISVNNFNDNINEGLTTLLKNYLYAKKENNVITLFSSNIILYLFVLLLCFVFGLCAVGTPFVFSVPLFLGLLFGVVITLLYKNYSLSGLGYCALINIPAFAIISATIIKCCKESMYISMNILGLMWGNNIKSNKNILKDYTIKYAVFTIPIVLSSLISTVLFKLFSGLFTFIG